MTRLALVGCLLTGCGEDPTRPLPEYGPEAVSYFREIAFGTESGSGFDVVHKWVDHPVVYFDTTGVPHYDREVVATVTRELDELTGRIDIDLVEVAGVRTDGIWLHYTSADSFEIYHPGLGHAELRGLFYYWWNNRAEIYRARVLIADDESDPQRRAHAIREELTQSLGLGRDSWSYAESIFYQGASTVTAFSDLDRVVIQMLYDSRIEPGMGVDEVVNALER